MKLSIFNITSYFSISIVFFVAFSGCSSDKNAYRFSIKQEAEVDTLHLKTINIFLETSVSMKGYVNSNVYGNYPLKDVLPFMVTDLNTTFNLKSNLYTISDKQRKVTYSNTIFFNKLRSGSLFNGKSSKLQNIFTDIIDETASETVSILITDCIPDLGNVNTMTEGSKITSHIYNSIAGKKSLGVAVFKYDSDFNGTHYFNRLNNKGAPITKRPFYNKILENRPFYVWFFGDKILVRKILSKNVLKEYNASQGYNLSGSLVNAGLLDKPKSGKISVNSKTNRIIIKSVEQKKTAMFTLGMDLSNMSYLQKEQFLDTLNYEVYPSYMNNGIGFKVKDKKTLLSEKIKDKSAIENTSYTHFIQPTLYEFDLEAETVSINIHNRELRWVSSSNITDDVDVSEAELEHKTFGFSFITDAFKKAFPEKSPKLQIILKKQQRK